MQKGKFRGVGWPNDNNKCNMAIAIKISARKPTQEDAGGVMLIDARSTVIPSPRAPFWSFVCSISRKSFGTESERNGDFNDHLPTAAMLTYTHTYTRIHSKKLLTSKQLSAHSALSCINELTEPDNSCPRWWVLAPLTSALGDKIGEIEETPPGQTSYVCPQSTKRLAWCTRLLRLDTPVAGVHRKRFCLNRTNERRPEERTWMDLKC